MNNLAKLGIAVGAGVTAGMLNLIYLNSKDQPTQYLALSREASAIKAGELFPSDPNTYIPLGIPGDTRQLNATLILYENRAVVFGLRAGRDFQGGDPIFYRDIAEDIPRFELLGPFRLLSVGQQLIGSSDESRAAGGSVITVQPDLDESGAPGQYDEKTRRLLEIVDAQSNQENNSASQLRILGVVGHPTSGPGPKAGSASQTPAPVYQADEAIFVPVSNDVVTDVLEIGTQISFRVPTYP